ncbi:MAG: hypothetical protein IIX93_10325 [Clostridia bacterium]|nr:hypothetical protein [Clostridia bacterium]
MAKKAKKAKKNRLFRRYTKGKLFFRNFRFFIFYLALLAAIGFGFYKVYLYLDNCLTSYEKAQSSYVAEDMASMFIEGRYDEIYNYEDASKLVMESKEDYVEYLKKLTEGTYITYKEVGTRVPDERKFSVTSNGKSFASFTIRKNGESVDCGLFGVVDLYEFGNVTTDIIQPITYQVTIPDDAQLIVNDEVIGKDNIVKDGITTFASGHLPKDYPSYTLCTYRFTIALGIPEIEAFDVNGKKLALTETAQDVFEHIFTYSDEELKPIHEKYIVEVGQSICMFMTENCSKYTVLKLLKDNSPAAKAINETDSHWLTEAQKYSFRNIRTENYVQYSDTLFSCELYLDFDTVSRHVENSYPYHIRFFVQKVGNDWKVYDFVNI